LPYESALVKRQTIEEYLKGNARSRSSFRLWLSALKETDWDIPEDILKTFGSTDLLGKGTDRAVFDLGGNNYRMICHFVFGEKQVHLFICWIGTHSEYSKLCKQNKQFSVSIY